MRAGKRIEDTDRKDVGWLIRGTGARLETLLLALFKKRNRRKKFSVTTGGQKL